MSSASPVASWYYNNNSHFHQSIPTSHNVVGPPGNGITDGYVAYGKSLVIFNYFFFFFINYTYH